MPENQADVVVLFSGEIIQEVMGRYLQELMPGKYVRVVQSQPTQDGYAFSLSFSEPIREVPKIKVGKKFHVPRSNITSIEEQYKLAQMQQAAMGYGRNGRTGEVFEESEEDEQMISNQRSLQELLANLESESEITHE